MKPEREKFQTSSSGKPVTAEEVRPVPKNDCSH